MDSQAALQRQPPEFDADRWADRGRGLFIQRLFLAGHELPEWELVSSRPPFDLDDRRFLAYGWQPVERTGATLQCDLIECASARRAHETLVELLFEYEGPGWAELDDETLGDVGFSPRGDRSTWASIFVRGNVVVRVHNGERELVPVGDVAAGLDQLLASEPEPSQAGVVPVIDSFGAATRQVSRAERVALSVEVADPLGRDVWLKYVASGGEFEATEGAISFRALGDGSYPISVYATNPNGGVARANTEVDVG